MIQNAGCEFERPSIERQSARHGRLVAQTVGVAVLIQFAIVALVLADIFAPATESFAQKPKSKSKTPRSAAEKQKPEKAPPKSDAATKPSASKESADEERMKLSDLRKEEPLPRLKDLPVPTLEELNKNPVDWIVLKGPDHENPQVVVAKPVFPRPDTLKKLEASLEELKKLPRPATEEERDRLAAEKIELQSLVITLPSDTEGQIYEIPTKTIERIIYHEDLIIRRAGLMIEEKQFRPAFELLFALQRRAPTWSGLEEQTQRLLLLEAEDSSQKGDLESALSFLEDLHDRNRNYPMLHERLGETVDKLIERCRQEKQYRESRHFLAQLVRIEPKHEIVAKWNNSLLADARKLIESAIDDFRQGRHEEAISLVDRAARIWPSTSGLSDVYRQLNDRYQRLEVGVLHLPGAAPLPFPTLASEREKALTQIDLFEVDRIDDVTHYRSRMFEQWEPTDLGRRAVFSLKTNRARWESRQVLTASDVLATIESRLNPVSPNYDERLSGAVSGVRLRSSFEFELQFSHPPPRTELLFRFPVTERADIGMAPASADETGSRQGRILSQRFVRVRGNADEVVYRRSIPQPDGLGEYRMAEVHERRYDSTKHAIQALMRGEVSMLADLPTWLVSGFRDDQRFFVLDFASPTTHVLQFNPRSSACKSRELRLALAYAIDSRGILSGIVLRDPAMQSGRLVTAPFATSSYAYNTLVLPREPNLHVAASLFDAAKKRLKASPHLRMLCSPGVPSQAAASEIVKECKRIHIDLELVPNDPTAVGTAADNWDVAYRTLRMQEPFTDLWPFLTLGSRARLEELRYLPDWLRKELLDLDNSPDWKTAVARLQELHAHLFSEVEYIPLWEVDDAVVLRKNVHDFPASRLVHTYQDIERWTVTSWYPEDTP